MGTAHTGVLATRNYDRVGLRIDATRAPVRTFTPDGRLKHVDYTACMGFGDVVQNYGDRSELRPGSEVCDPEAMASFESLPFADEHPDDGIDAENAAEVTRGVVLKTWAEYPDMWGTIRVLDAGTIARIDGGKQGLSMGYNVLAPDATPGNLDGVAYQVVQRKIRGDHAALARSPRGERGGDTPRIYMDSSDAPVRVQKDVSMKKIKIKLPDGSEVEVEVPEAVATYLETLLKSAEAEPPKGQGNPPGAPPTAPVEDAKMGDSQPAAPRADSRGIDAQTAERLIKQALDAERPRARAEARADSLAYGALRAEAEPVLRLDGKSVAWTGDVARDQLAVAEQLLGADDVDVKAAKAKLMSRVDSDVSNAVAVAPGLYKAAIVSARARHDQSRGQLDGLVTRHDSADEIDATLTAAAAGYRPTK